MKTTYFFITLGAFLLFINCSSSQKSSNAADGSTKAKPFRNVTSTHLKSSNLGRNTMDGQVIDIDNDGDLDLVLAIEYRPNVILINNGKGVLTDESAQRLPRNNHDSEDIAIADFDGDGDPDIVYVSEDDEKNEFYHNKGNGYFEDASHLIPVKGTSNAVETADIDKDGDFDLLIGNAGQNVILINDGKANFTDETTTRLPANTYTTQDIELGDIDNDGDLDILEGNETYNRILINDGKGVFKDESSIRLPKINDQTREADFGDIDGDGDLDIIFANVDFDGFGDPQNRLLLNNGQGKFIESTQRLPASKIRTVDADFVDLDGDGDLDILSGNRFNGSEKLVLINDGKASFTDKTTAFFPSINMYPFDFQVADFNKDGKLDIYICGFRGDDMLLFGN